MSLPDYPENPEDEIGYGPESTPIADRIGEGREEPEEEEGGHGSDDLFDSNDKPSESDRPGEQSPDRVGQAKDQAERAKNVKDKMRGGEKAAKAGEKGAKNAAKQTGKQAAKETGKQVAKQAAKETAKKGVEGALSGTVVGAPVAAGIEAADQLSKLKSAKGRRNLLIALIVSISPFFLTLGMAILVVMLFLIPLFGLDMGTGEAASDGTGSQLLTISKTANPNLIARNASNAVVNYSIVVTNNSDIEALSVAISDRFSSSPNEAATFAGELTYDQTYLVGTLAPGESRTFNFSVTIPHTDFDPGWVLTNTATVSGAINEQTETSSTNTTVVIGDPPVMPPTGCPMIGAITTPYGRNISGYPLASHDGVDLGDGVKNNAPVYATISGQLRYANYTSPSNGALTERIIISNGTYQVEYFHLSPVGKALEGPVVVGQVIGHEDETGYTFGEHLHYEVRVNDVRVNPTTYMSANLNYSQPANDDFSGIADQAWGTCDVLPAGAAPPTPAPPPPPTTLECMSFSGNWTNEEKTELTNAFATPRRSQTWVNLLCGAGAATLERVNSDPGFNAEVKGGRTLYIYNAFFGNGSGIKTITTAGRAFVLTHELTHIIKNSNPGVYSQYLNSSATTEFNNKWVIRSYPLCDAASRTCNGVDPADEDFAEMAANYVGDREGYPINFPSEYPEHNNFARDILFGGISF